MDKTQPGRLKARRPAGLIDQRGAACALRSRLVERISGVYQRWGFEALETPAFEYADAIGKFLPDQDRPNEGVFALEDDDGQWLALRYDLTAPLARFVTENFDALPKPYRRWAAGPIWRNEKPGPGRYREFWQCDADTIGAPAPAADAEMIAMLAEALGAAGLAPGAFVIKVNTRRLLNAALEAAGLPEEAGAARLSALRAIDKLDRLGLEGVRLLLGPGRKDDSGDFTKGAGLAPAAIEAILAFLDAGRPSRGETLRALEAALPAGAERDAGLAELAGMDAILSALGVEAAIFDPAIVRGLEYYTGPVFEAEFLGGVAGEDGKPIRFGSIGSGGRYDDLVARFRGQPAPATGCSVGVSRLAALMSLTETAPAAEAAPVVVLALEPARIAESFAMAAELRAAGIVAEAYVGGAGMKAQLKYADRRGSPIAVIEGEDERARGVVTLKDLALGAALAKSIEGRDAWREAKPAQSEVARAELVATVRAMLDGTNSP